MLGAGQSALFERPLIILIYQILSLDCLVVRQIVVWLSGAAYRMRWREPV